jgi:CheY-like chemotaxis protein
MDGYELAGRLRGDARLAGTALIAMTGYGLDSDRRQSRAAGFREHLVKPLSLRSISDVVADCLADAQPRQP